MTKLSKAGAESGHLLATFVSDIDLIRVYFSKQQIHVDKGLVKLFFQYFQPAKHRHTRDRALAYRRAASRSGHIEG